MRMRSAFMLRPRHRLRHGIWARIAWIVSISLAAEEARKMFRQPCAGGTEASPTLREQLFSTVALCSSAPCQATARSSDNVTWPKSDPWPNLS
jgi:hypothetical protein